MSLRSTLRFIVWNCYQGTIQSAKYEGDQKYVEPGLTHEFEKYSGFIVWNCYQGTVQSAKYEGDQKYVEDAIRQRIKGSRCWRSCHLQHHLVFSCLFPSGSSCRNDCRSRWSQCGTHVSPWKTEFSLTLQSLRVAGAAVTCTWPTRSSPATPNR